MDVRLPDGTLIRDVPDGMSKADLSAKLKANGYDIGKLDAPAYQGASSPASPPGMLATLGGSIGKGIGDVALGAQRYLGKGLQSVGADKAGQWLVNDAETGKANMAEQLAPYKAANPMTATVGETAGNVLATLPVGGALAIPVKAAAKAIPALAPIGNAISSAGFTTGVKAAPGAAGLASNMLTRAAGGAVTGGASAGLVDPNSAAMGAGIGAALPGGLAVLGQAGNKLAGILKGPNQSPEVQAAIQAARDAGYVIPPSQANPTLLNRAMEGMSGKITTAQNASAKNAPVTSDLAATALGLPTGSPITLDALNGVRKRAGQAYEEVANSGTVTPGPAYEAALDKITAQAKSAAQGFPSAKPNPLIAEIDSLKTPQADARAIVDKIGELRDAATKAYAGSDKQLGKAYKDASSALEDALDAHLQSINAPPEVLQNLREARQLIAKSYTVQSALNPTTGAINAKKIGADIMKGKPITGGLETIGDFANRFPKAAQTVEGMGSLPQTSPLDWHAMAASSVALHNPLAMLGVLARPAARYGTLSPLVQNNLIQGQGGNQLKALMADPRLQQLIYRGAPATVAGR